MLVNVETAWTVTGRLQRKRRLEMAPTLSPMAFAFGLLLLVPAGWATAAEKHSGVVVAADEGKITIDEMGPWHGPATKPIRRTFVRRDSTRIVWRNDLRMAPEDSRGRSRISRRCRP